nr:immunoglobulin light chain junction region [Macaca mulatta]MOW62341.1 immunoglobulin light chain junction region [Macaca mulatta]MOW64041.1 immunoglobulin light chain junction region [Macaca mulatta]MOW65977.1 immunoglobulin light chain junction region [Macaca mulatta]
CQQVYSNPFSF